MSQKYNVLVFPCGSEIGLEIHRSLKYSTHINLFGANSIDDHGKFVYNNYISGLPFFDQPGFVKALSKVIKDKNIDAVYPAMDSVIAKLSELQNQLQCKIIGSSTETNQICLSKKQTYKMLRDSILIPESFGDLESVNDFPVFMKPDVGYGSRGAKVIFDIHEGRQHLIDFPESIILENLPGREFTIDCFTDRNRKLIFSGPRERKRIMNGISVNTVPVTEKIAEFEELAEKINEKIHFRGAWFFQVKENNKGDLALLEVASRLGGSSALFRNIGVNFALLSIFDAFNHDVEIFLNNYTIELDRSLNNRYKVGIFYEIVYVDFDDCILLSTKLNTQLITFLFQAVNEGKKLILLTKHEKDIHTTLKQLRLSQLFDKVIHISKQDNKWEYMEKETAIFIDDSFAERKLVYEKLKIPVFAPDAVECLIN